MPAMFMEIILVVVTISLSALAAFLVVMIMSIPSHSKAAAVFGKNPDVSRVAKGMMNHEFGDTVSDDGIQGFGFEISENGEVTLFPHSTVSSHSMQKLLQA